MTTTKQRLNELLKEQKARAAIQKKRGSVHVKKPVRSWMEKRAHWIKRYKEHPEYDVPAGELANMIDGLTPDGYDRTGKKVSFVEREFPRGENSRISSNRSIYVNRRES